MYVEIDTRTNNPVPSISTSNGASFPVESDENAGTDEPVVVTENTSLNTTARSQGTVGKLSPIFLFSRVRMKYFLFKNTLPLGSRSPAQSSEAKTSLRYWSLPRGTSNEEHSTTELSNPSKS